MLKISAKVISSFKRNQAVVAHFKSKKRKEDNDDL